METVAYRNPHRRTDQFRLWRLICLAATCSVLADARADIPWPEVEERVKIENEKLAQRPQGHDGEYFLVCTLYYTPMESGFTAERGFDATPVTKPGLNRRKYPRDFLLSVKQEGFGRIITPVKGRNYIRYNGGNSFAFSNSPTGGGRDLVARSSAGARHGRGGFTKDTMIETFSETVQEAFGNTRWKIADTGGGLHRWQIDCYWGEDEPFGPGALMARPRGTTFEYAYIEAKVVRN